MPQPGKWETAWIGLGSNLGDRLGHLALAVRALRGIPGVSVRAVSPVYSSAAVGFRRQPHFFNAAVRVRTTIPPVRLLRRMQSVERALGRVRGRRFGPRQIDLDLLLYGARLMRSRALTLPHPRLVERAFVLAPIAAVPPSQVVSGTGKTVATLLGRVGTRARRLPASAREQIFHG